MFVSPTMQERAAPPAGSAAERYSGGTLQRRSVTAAERYSGGALQRRTFWVNMDADLIGALFEG